MFARPFSQKSAAQQSPAATPPQGCLTDMDLDPHVVVHYGIPSTASVLAFDHVQCLLAIGTLDGRIKLVGGDNIEAILASSKPLPFKNLEFIQNQGFLVSISNENEIQVWDLECRQAASTLQWESNVTAFSILHGTSYMYIGDEYGMVTVLKYDTEEGKLKHLPYYVPTNALAEAAGLLTPIENPVVGILFQPFSKGNRLLIALLSGLLFLWDASEDRVVLVRGNRDLPLEGKTVGDSAEAAQDELSDLEVEGKEISSLCWASTDGSVLAVGYIDGDILLWNFSDQQVGKSSSHVVKLQLSSARRRLPVIVMNWCLDTSRKDSGGKLFIYGGDVVGSEEVLTMLSLDWSAGLGGLKCVGRVDLTLNGSFADMVLSPVACSMQSRKFLFLLTNPGQLHVYDDAALMSQQDKEACISPLLYTMAVPTMDPSITITMLGLLHGNVESSRFLSEIVSAAKVHASHTTSTTNANWPLTGGICGPPIIAEDYTVERLYIAGYQDGSVRIWDATCPFLSLIFVIGPDVKGVDVAGASASVSAVNLCSQSLHLAIGNECGMVRVYSLLGQKGETCLKILTNAGKQVHVLLQEDGPQCMALFSFLSSPVCAMQSAESAKRLAVGFKCGRVAMLDISTSSLLFLTDSISNTSSSISSLSVKSFLDASGSFKDPNNSETTNLDVATELVVVAMARDANVALLDGKSGNILGHSSKHPKAAAAISLHILEDPIMNSKVHTAKPAQNSSEKNEAENKSEPNNGHGESIPLNAAQDASAQAKSSGQRLTNLFILLCCENFLRLYSLKSLSQGVSKCNLEVNLSKPCCWAATFKKDEEDCGLLLLYRTGMIEIRSFPNLEVVAESSLMSLLRWNYKTNMEKTMFCSDRGHVVLINGCEFALLSLLSQENDFRIPESLPCLHDRVLAAAADAAFSQFPIHKKKQDTAPKILSSIIKGFRKSNEQNTDQVRIRNDFSHLESIFSNPPYSKPSVAGKDDEKTIELSIDNIEIDEPATVLSSSHKNKKEHKDKGTERERLFEGASADTQPRMRTVEEIKAKYGKAGDAPAAASQARDKLLERQEKLERISQRTAELQSGAENFAAMANELVKQMEKRKWWHI